MRLSPESLAEARAWVVGRVRECAVGHQVDLLSAEIAVGEILQNIIRYAYEGAGPITLRVSDLDEAVGISVIDSARPSDPSDWISDKPSVDGGLGLSVVKNAVDAYLFRPLLEGNKASIYFFPGRSHFSDVALAWAGEMLDARVFSESLEEWSYCALSTSSMDAEFSMLLRSSIELVEGHHKKCSNVPAYHNIDHFRDVLVTVCYAVNELGDSLNDLDVKSLVLAALLHDYAHPGGRPDYAGYFEDNTLNCLSPFFERIKESSNGAIPLIEQVLCLIRGTSPLEISAAKLSPLQRLFNLCDAAGSFIDWFGLHQSEKLLSEMGMEQSNTDPKTIYTQFKARFEGQEALQFLNCWIK